MIKNRLIITGVLAVVFGLGMVSITGIKTKATIKNSLVKYEKDTKAIEHIDAWLKSEVADITSTHYNAKATEHMNLIKAYLTAKDFEEKSDVMIKINAIEKEENDEKEFYEFFKNHRYLTQSLQDKCKELYKEGKSEEARLYINKKMDLMKELYANKDKYKNPELKGEGLKSYWKYDK